MPPLSKPGFAVAVYSIEEGSTYFLRIVDELGAEPSTFRALESGVDVVLHPKTIQVRDSDEPIYVFIDSDVHVGTLDELRTFLESFRRNETVNSGVALQIAELLDGPIGRKVARRNVYEKLKERIGERGARSFYEGSVLRAAAWDVLVRAATTVEARKRVLAARSRISACVLDGKIKVNVEGIDPADYGGMSSEQIHSVLQTEFDLGFQAASAPLPTRVVDASENPIDALLNFVSRSRKQEERIAILLKAILENPKIGLGAVYSYVPRRAKFEAEVVRLIREKIDGMDIKTVEIQVARLVERLYKSAYPRGRGDLLYYITAYLGGYSGVRHFVKDRLTRSGGILFNEHRGKIEAELARHEVSSALSGDHRSR